MAGTGLDGEGQARRRSVVGKLQPALLGGAFLGVLSALPIVSAANLCCCLWVVAGGVLAAYLLQQGQSASITLGDGAAVGFWAGVVGAFVYVVAALPMQFVLAPLQRRMTEQVLDRVRDIPPELREVLQDVNVGAVGLAVGFVFMLIVGVVFATTGGALGAALFAKAAQLEPPTPSTVPPSA